MCGHDRDVGESGAIARSDAIARFDLVGEDFQFFDQYRSLNGIEPAGNADARGLGAIDALAVQPDALYARR